MSATGRRSRPTLGTLLAGAAVAASLAMAGEPAAPGRRVDPHAGWESAFEAALADGEPILLVFHVPGCGACRRLQEETLRNESFRIEAAPLHLVTLDVEEEPRLASEYRVQAVPDLLLVTGEGQIVLRRQGFLDREGLLTWLREGRERIAQGRWEGMAAADREADLVRRAGTGGLRESEIGEATKRLGAADPALRATGLAVFVALEAKGIPTLLQAAADPYLGTRLAAVEVLERFAPDAPAMDPWADPDARTEQLRTLAEWWNRDGRPAAVFETGAKRAAAPPPDARRVETLLEGVLSERPMQRTESLNALLHIGAEALPAIREALKRSERLGRARACRSLEDLRWAILVPGEVERAAPGTRRGLARGTGAERLAAVERLARAGRAALPALGELLRDGDPLVRERALHSLSAVGGPEAIAAMSQLLNSPDANLRMTAAQDLGRTKDRAASESLATAVADPDEVVACTALAAIEELKAKNRQDTILAALKDPRWRVRARAAEAAGKLELGGAADALRELLKDTDPFVLKSALEALKALKATPPQADLLALLDRAPELTSLVVEFLLGEEEKSFPSLLALYKKADPAGRVRLLDAMAPHRGRYSSRHGQDTHWKEFIALAAAEADLEIRRRAARLLLLRSPEVAGPFVEGFLGINDRQIFETLCPRILTLAAYHWGIGEAPDRQGEENAASVPCEFGVLYAPPDDKPESKTARGFIQELVSKAGDALRKTGRKNEKKDASESAAAVAERVRKAHAAWHERLKAQAGADPSLAAALAIYVTGDPLTGLEALNRALDRPAETLEQAFKELDTGSVLGILLRRVPWPGGKPAFERLAAHPTLYAAALTQLAYAPPDLRAFLAAPERQVAMARKASRDTLATLVELWIVSEKRYGRDASLVALCEPTPENDALIERLAASGEGPLLAAATFLRGHHRTDPASLALVERALGHTDPWVRFAAIRGVWARIKDRVRLETLVGPMLADPHDVVATAAAHALLSDELRAVAGMDNDFQRFRYETIDLWRNFTSSYEVRERPLKRIEAQPEFLPRARERLVEVKKRIPRPLAPREADDDTRGPVLLQSALALLLAQYGDLTGLDQLAERPVGKELPEDMLAGIRLTQEPRYLPLLVQAAQQAERRQDLQSLLKAAAEMTGDEARRFRREVNRRLRELAE